MKTRLHIQSSSFAVSIYKEFLHDDRYEDDQLNVFVRGNGYWLEPVEWLNAERIATLFKNDQLALDQIDGTFFIVIYDKVKDEILLIPDHLNFFPLYILKSDLGIEISDSLAHFINSDIDQQLLKELVSMNSIIGRRTLLQGVEKLAEAHLTRIGKEGNLQEERYWKCQPVPTNSYEFKEILSATIARIPQLSKSPSLTFTAGLDSRMIFSELVKQKTKFSTFTFGHAGAVDVSTASQIAKDFNIPHVGYQTDTTNDHFIGDFKENVDSCISYSDGMVPFIRGAAANYCFKQESENSDMIITATGELVYSHYAEVPTLLPKNNSSLDAIAQFLVDFNADNKRPVKYSDLSDVKESLISYFNEYSLPHNILYYDAFYLSKLSGLTSYYQQFLSSNIRIYNPIFTKSMINHSMGLDQSLRDHRKLQRDIIVENDQRLNDYLVNGFKVVKPSILNIIRAKFNYGLRLAKKLVNKLTGTQIFSVSYLNYRTLLEASNMFRDLQNSRRIKDLPLPTNSSSESYLLNYLSIKKWLEYFNQSKQERSD